MLAAQFLAMERSIEQAMRSLSERADMCRTMYEKAQASDFARPTSTQWEAAMVEALEQTAPLRTMLTREWLHPNADGPIELSSP